jgi:2-dehydropantoate 2-reductase
VRIGIVGAGAIGAALAALLDRSGHEVVVTARGDALGVIERDGIVLTGGWGEHTAPVEARAALEGRFDLVVFAVKAPDLAEAVEANRSADFPLALVVRNGLGARDELIRLLGTDRHPSPSIAPVSVAPVSVAGGLAVFAASLTGPGRVAVTTPAPLYVGGAGSADVADLLGPALPVVRLADLRGAEWTKLVVNQVNALPAITGLSVQETIADRGLRRVLTRSIRETVSVGLASGVHFAPLQGLSHPLLRTVRLVPEAVAELLPRLMRRRMGSRPNPGSTQQSIRRGRPTEVDWLNGAVVGAAEAAGLEAPVNRRITELVHQVERTGAFLSPAQVVAEMPRPA